eukprot:2133343-Alexandrium_andersonii.AAC.1
MCIRDSLKEEQLRTEPAFIRVSQGLNMKRLVVQSKGHNKEPIRPEPRLNTGSRGVPKGSNRDRIGAQWGCPRKLAAHNKE